MSQSNAAEWLNPFISSLGKGREAFHAEVTEFALRSGERTPDDFLRHFSCRTIMRSLDARPTERARIVSQSTGVHEKIAHRMSADASGESLQIALDEGVTTSEAIVKLFHPDDKQRYLERHALWAFDVEGQPWKTAPASKIAYDRAKVFIAYILERALENLLFSPEEVVRAISVPKLAQSLPKEKLGSIIDASLRSGDKYTEEDLLETIRLQSLVEYIGLDYLWERVISPLVAEGHDYAPRPATVAFDKSSPTTNSRLLGSVDGDWTGESSRSGSEPLASRIAADEAEIVSEDEILDSEDNPRIASDVAHKAGEAKKARHA